MKRTLQTTPFHFLRKADAENLLTFIKDEHPQTIAVIMAHMPSSKGAEVLSRKALKAIKGGNTYSGCNKFGICQLTCDGRPKRCTSHADCPNFNDCGNHQ